VKLPYVDPRLVAGLVTTLGQVNIYVRNQLPHAGSGGCKNRPAPFPGRMSYKATKPGLVLFYILAGFNCIVAC